MGFQMPLGQFSCFIGPFGFPGGLETEKEQGGHDQNCWVNGLSSHRGFRV